MPLIATKLNTQPARHQVAEKIRESILDGSLVPGERLVERKLAETLGTSQSAIREALIQLELEGHVSKKPNSATFVTHFSQRELENTISVRRALEGFRCRGSSSPVNACGYSASGRTLSAIPGRCPGTRISEIHPSGFELAHRHVGIDTQ